MKTFKIISKIKIASIVLLLVLAICNAVSKDYSEALAWTCAMSIALDYFIYKDIYQDISEKDLISFGNYLLSKERNDMFFEESQYKGEVNQSDINNWKDKQLHTS